jgi:hypothetical protein
MGGNVKKPFAACPKSTSSFIFSPKRFTLDLPKAVKTIWTSDDHGCSLTSVCRISQE